MSVTLEDSSNSKSRYIGHRDLTEDDIRYNAELDREDRTIRSRKRRRHKSRLKKRDLEERGSAEIKVGYVCAGNKKLSDLWEADYEKEEMQTQRRKRKKYSDQDKKEN